MFGKKSVETLVVGAGPTGMLAALVLADNGHDVAIVDAAPRTCTSTNSATLHPETLQVFERLGMTERLEKAGYRIDRVNIYDDLVRRQSLDLSHLPIPFSHALVVPQSELELFLEEELEQAGVRILWNHRVSDYIAEGDKLNVTVDRYGEHGTGYAVSHMESVIEKTLHFRAQNVLAADGYNSTLRRMAGVNQSSLGEDQYFISFEFETDSDPNHTSLISIANELTTAQLPIADGIARLQFQFTGLTLPSRNREKDRSYMHDKANLPDYLDEKHFAELVKHRVPWQTGYINRLRYRAAIPFQKRYTEKPRSGSVFFIGDSARSFGPLGSLSLNLGAQEAEQVAKVILKTTDDIRERDERLDQLGQRMVSNWKQLTNLENFSDPDDCADSWVVAHRGRILRSLPATGESLVRLARQTFVHVRSEEYCPSPI